MMLILRQVAALLVCLVLLYIAVLGMTLALARPPSQRGELDSSLAGGTIFMTEPKYIYLNRTPLGDASNKIVFVGSSNVATGFKLSEIRALLPVGVRVHKLAVGGANMTEMRQVIDLVQEVQSEDARQHQILVLGIWYGMFGKDRLRWYTSDRFPGDTDIDIERYRYGFEWRTSQGPIRIVPWRYVDLAVSAISPFLVLDKLSRDTLAWLSNAYSGPPRDLDAVVLSEARKKSLLDYWLKTMGPAGTGTMDEQFSVLEQACATVLSQGSSLLLVNLPLPRWHKERSPYEQPYQHAVARLVSRWTGRPGFGFIDMTKLDSDGDFYDEVHPKPHVTIEWAKRLAAALSPLAAPEASVAGTVSDTLPRSRIR